MPHLILDPDENKIWLRPKQNEDIHIWILRRTGDNVQLSAFQSKMLQSFHKRLSAVFSCISLRKASGRHFLQEWLWCASWPRGRFVAAFMTLKTHFINSLDQTELSLVSTFYRPWKAKISKKICCLKQSCKQHLWSIILISKSRIAIFINIAWIFLFVPTKQLLNICSFVIYPKIGFNS